MKKIHGNIFITNMTIVHYSAAGPASAVSCKTQQQLLIEILILTKLPRKAPALVGGLTVLPGQYDLHIHDD